MTRVRMMFDAIERSENNNFILYEAGTSYDVPNFIAESLLNSGMAYTDKAIMGRAEVIKDAKDNY
jgi:hypothetical protein